MFIYITDTIISCYQGSCEQCKQYCYVYDGEQPKWARPYLRSCPEYHYGCRTAFINPKDSDKNILIYHVYVIYNYIQLHHTGSSFSCELYIFFTLYYNLDTYICTLCHCEYSAHLYLICNIRPCI